MFCHIGLNIVKPKMLPYSKQPFKLPLPFVVFVTLLITQSSYVKAGTEEESQPNDIENLEDIPLNGRIVVPSVQASGELLLLFL